MSKFDHKNHPYHYTGDKNILQYLIDWGVPIGLFILYFQYYNFGKFNPSEMIKTSGLMAIALLALTLVIGPLARFIPALDSLKAHRKVWGIVSFLFVIIHLSLYLIFYLKLNFSALFNTANPKFLGLFMGTGAFLILLVVTLTSNKTALKNLDPKVWKAIQTTSYIALILALTHFYLMEQVKEVLTIKRLLGQITFGFAAIVTVIRLVVLFLPSKRK